MLTEIHIEHHGIHHEQYFQGAGISGTRWESCITGVGDCPSEALDDALTQACMSTCFPDDDAPTVELLVEDLRNLEDDNGYEDVGSDECHYYATMYWRYL